MNTLNLSGYTRVVIKNPQNNLSLICDDNGMNINGIDIAKHIENRFWASIHPDRVMRVVLFFGRNDKPNLVASRAYGIAKAKNGTIVSCFCFEHRPFLSKFEFSLEDRLENARSLSDYRHSIIIGRTEDNWNRSGYIYQVDMRRPIRPSREVLASVLKGIQNGTLDRKSAFDHELAARAPSLI